ncbi:MAG: VPLPA-CTERM sorting domain-containing protein [Pseudomonadota bacterium]
MIEQTQSASVTVSDTFVNQEFFFDITGDTTDDIKIQSVNTGNDHVELKSTSGTGGPTSRWLLEAPGDVNFAAGAIIDGSRDRRGDNSAELVANAGGGAFSFGSPDVTGFLGLSIDLAGEEHFAWIELQVVEDLTEGTVTVNVLRSGFEDVAGVGIIAGSSTSLADVPVPASLLLLASGAAGLAALRRRRKSATA